MCDECILFSADVNKCGKMLCNIFMKVKTNIFLHQRNQANVFHVEASSIFSVVLDH